MALKVSFPLLCVTGGQKLAYSTAMQEKLQIEHNAEGDRYKADMERYAKNELTRDEAIVAANRWDTYRDTLFEPASNLIMNEVLKWRAHTKRFLNWNPDLSKDIINVVEP